MLTQVCHDVEENLVATHEWHRAVKHAEGLFQGHRGERGVVGGEGDAGQLGLEVNSWRRNMEGR